MLHGRLDLPEKPQAKTSLPHLARQLSFRLRALEDQLLDQAGIERPFRYLEFCGISSDLYELNGAEDIFGVGPQHGAVQRALEMDVAPSRQRTRGQANVITPYKDALGLVWHQLKNCPGKNAPSRNGMVKACPFGYNTPALSRLIETCHWAYLPVSAPRELTG